jgi:hypothetical protein
MMDLTDERPLPGLGLMNGFDETTMEQTLLLTATITPPPDAINLVRNDPKVRLGDYLGALEFYLKQPNDIIRSILFVDNSNSDLSELRRLADRYPGKKVEFIGFFGLDYPAPYGRGFGESRLMDYAFDHSETIAGLRPEDRIWKSTGRFKVTNIGTMIRKAPKVYDVYCDMRNRPAYWVDMRIFSCTKEGFRKVFYGIGERLREDVDKYAAEHYLREILEEKSTEARIIPRFRTHPFVEGFAGAFNTNFAHGTYNKSKNYIRVLSRIFAPNLWI